MGYVIDREIRNVTDVVSSQHFFVHTIVWTVVSDTYLDFLPVTRVVTIRYKVLEVGNSELSRFCYP